MATITLPAEPPRHRLVLADVLRALADPLRLDYVAGLDGAGEVVCGIPYPDVPKSTLSHHFRTLRETGVITSRRCGKTILNALRRADLDARFPGLLDAVIAARPAGRSPGSPVAKGATAPHNHGRPGRRGRRSSAAAVRKDNRT